MTPPLPIGSTAAVWSPPVVQICPRCNEHLDAAVSVMGRAQPSPGDVTVCIYCTLVSTFEADYSLTECTDPSVLNDPVIVQVQQRIMALDRSGFMWKPGELRSTITGHPAETPAGSSVLRRP